MQGHTARGNVGKTAIGYVRGSTQEQATEGLAWTRRGIGCGLLVPLASEQVVIGRIGALHAGNLKLAEIARRLNADQISARQGGAWCGRVVSVILRRAGTYTVQPSTPRGPRIHDKAAAATRARELRAEGLSLREVGIRLALEGQVPELGGAWYPKRVSRLLTGGNPSP